MEVLLQVSLSPDPNFKTRSFPIKSKLNQEIPAIVLAHFGTTYPEALKSLENEKRIIEMNFPGVPVGVAFTSNIIRKIWRERNEKNPREWVDLGVSKEILNIKGVLFAISQFQDLGYKTIIVQPSHIFHGEQYTDLKSYIQGLNSIQTVKKRWMPFEKIVLGRPALGTYGTDFDYKEDIQQTVEALRDDFELAKRKKAMLVYVGHGNDFYSSGVFYETQKLMNKLHPEIKTMIGMVEGLPDLDDVVIQLKEEYQKTGNKKVILKPLMDTAGDHAHNDIAAEKETSWYGRLTLEGFHVEVIMEGLGSKNSFAQIFADRIFQTAKFHEIELPSKKETRSGRLNL